MDALPPPISNPPPVVVSAQPPARRRGRGWMILSCILAVLLGLSLWLLTRQWFGGSAGLRQPSALEETLVEDHQSQNKFLIVDVNGLITSEAWNRSGQSMVDFISREFDQAKQDDAVKAVILKIDSPGGEVMASDEIARAVREFQEKSKKPVIASMGGMAASGGYYISAPCRWIVANELTITGSIGVILETLNYRGLLDKVGLYPLVFKSGKFKDMLRGSKEPKEILPEASKMIQEMVDETFAKFKQVVQQGRDHAAELNRGQGRALQTDWQKSADGRVLTGKQAFALGFVDELGGFKTAVNRAKKLARVAAANLIRYEEPVSLAKILSFFGSASDSKIKIDLGLDLPKLKAGRMYFLSGTVLN